jgi:hypothetical protein
MWLRSKAYTCYYLHASQARICQSGMLVCCMGFVTLKLVPPIIRLKRSASSDVPKSAHSTPLLLISAVPLSSGSNYDATCHGLGIYVVNQKEAWLFLFQTWYGLYLQYKVQVDF